MIQTARLALQRRLQGWRLGRARQRAEQGEREAERLLRRAGYRIEAVQPAIPWVVYCDGAPHALELRADLLVSRGGRRYVAEVKTGASAPSLTTAATRRQLLEYSVAYDADGVLLVDMEASRIYDVSFPLPGTRRQSWIGRPALAAGIVALGIALWWLVTTLQ